MYDSANMAHNSNVIVVTVQLPSRTPGWFNHFALRTGDVLDDSGNFGTLDVIKALDWVSRISPTLAEIRTM